MKRREFIKNGIILFAAPAIIKIENLMKIAVPREMALVGNKDLGFDDFQRQLYWQISKAMQIPFELLIKDTRSVTYNSIDLYRG